MKEVWKEIEYSGYFISNFGRLKGRSGKILKTRLNKRTGYLDICLRPNGRKEKAKCLKIHRLVAKAFILNPNNFVIINHIDGNKLNNNVSNLEWCTESQNTQHAYNLKLIVPLKWYENERSKLTKEDVEWIRNNYIPFDKNFGCRKLAKKFKVSHVVVSDIITNKRYND